MLHYIDHGRMGHANHGWLDSHFHFSFAEYFNPKNIRFGIMRVLNDDIVQPSSGFPTHPHRDMEIISYVVQGELSHKDSMGNAHTLTRGQSQYMSAGTGVTHSEFNWGPDELRFIQTWIFPDKGGYEPTYGDHRFNWDDRINRWLPLATGHDNRQNTAPIKLHADANVYASVISAGEQLEFKVAPGRQAYLVLLEGDAVVGNIEMKERDAVEIIQQDVIITTQRHAHLYAVEMPFDEVCYTEKYGEYPPLTNGA